MNVAVLVYTATYVPCTCPHMSCSAMHICMAMGVPCIVALIILAKCFPRYVTLDSTPYLAIPVSFLSCAVCEQSMEVQYMHANGMHCSAHQSELHARPSKLCRVIVKTSAVYFVQGVSN